ncbi:uncharacterized protein FPRO_12652 [Fusarium proliferatum ET1]|uniref:Related to lignostilbene alphabeta-dioxygenase I n=1 Tax=Fusarium proliferatum (strain ET1) TaxID=1227346 RepID=A0A1L7W6B1_FUSPR|nr:uncharacterized protein FPRO_12652 [Fusarium proliferatum ET1]CZR48042.1 related to lignostilbene alphabeta-dioxygenase I [Fusarium proliferatum ET1]
MATLLNPEITLWTFIIKTLKFMWVIICSAWGWGDSRPPIRRISVANTNIVSHGGRVLATCESGPPMRILLPSLRTVGWFNGYHAEGELSGRHDCALRPGFGGNGLLKSFREWTTGHPHIDPITGEMVQFHSSFVWPYVQYSVLHGKKSKSLSGTQIFNSRVPGISSPKMMHDLGVSRQYTIIIDMPLSLNPLRLISKRPVIAFDPRGRTRFGIFPRHTPQNVQWLSTDACCIFHTVNTWDEKSTEVDKFQLNINMLVCRLSGPSIVFQAADLPVPNDQAVRKDECTLYYYRFSLSSNEICISQQWALSAIPFEFPHVPKHLTMSSTTFVYGCSVGQRDHTNEPQKSFKIGSIVKFNVQMLITEGIANPPVAVSGYVDDRTIGEILASQDSDDSIQIFPMPYGWYAQECTFVPREGGISEDDGWLLTYVFDESQLDALGHAPDSARSELWAIDAKSMKEVVMKVRLPQRVPYGLHGNWFTKDEITNQLSVKSHRG